MIGRRAATTSVRVTRRRGAAEKTAKDAVAVEEPLEIRLRYGAATDRKEIPLAVTMRTPGHDFELVAGFLHGEGVIRASTDLDELTYCRGGEQQEYNVVEARLAPAVRVDVESLRRNFYTTSSCGVCGKASLDAVEALGCERVGGDLRVEGSLLPSLPDRLLEGQGVFERTGGLHAAAFFTPDGTAGPVREDVGRHNAVDKVVGESFLGRSLPAEDRILVVSGRASFELVQKAIAAGAPMLVAVGAPSSLAVELAERFGQTLVGFARDGGYNVYTHPDRIV